MVGKKNLVGKQQTYEEAMNRIEQIIAQIEDNELKIDLLAERLNEAQQLIKLCKDKLYKVDKEVQQVLEKKSEK